MQSGYEGRERRVTVALPDDEVLTANETFYGAFNAKDVTAMDAIWARTAPVACVHPGWNIITGREEVMASWEAILSNPMQPRIVSGGARVLVPGEMAIVLCRELVAGSPLAATNIFVREAGGWKLVHHHSSPVARIDT